MFRRPSRKVLTHASGVSKTEQKWRDRQDVNSIVARCLRGDNSGLRTCGFHFADISNQPETLHDMLNQRKQMEMIYDGLPDEVRAKWKTPSDFVAACHDENERPNLEKFGLLKPKETEPDPVRVEVVNPSKEPVTATAAD